VFSGPPAEQDADADLPLGAHGTNSIYIRDDVNETLGSNLYIIY
jgi:hypothetical protein